MYSGSDQSCFCFIGLHPHYVSRLQDKSLDQNHAAQNNWLIVRCYNRGCNYDWHDSCCKVTSRGYEASDKSQLYAALRIDFFRMTVFNWLCIMFLPFRDEN